MGDHRTPFHADAGDHAAAKAEREHNSGLTIPSSPGTGRPASETHAIR